MNNFEVIQLAHLRESERNLIENEERKRSKDIGNILNKYFKGPTSKSDYNRQKLENELQSYNEELIENRELAEEIEWLLEEAEGIDMAKLRDLMNNFEVIQLAHLREFERSLKENEERKRSKDIGNILNKYFKGPTSKSDYNLQKLENELQSYNEELIENRELAEEIEWLLEEA
ncbi:hypothetical protein Q3G72_014765 [Acer saccharum]|nr:hypothetical protein Q3G72_014765 [Acer saccharum]